MKTPLQQLTDKIYTKLPKLKELGVGCELNCYQKQENEDLLITIVSETPKNYWIKKHYNNSVTYWNKETILDESSAELVTIIGKPPTLVDVLNYLKSFDNDIQSINIYGMFHDTSWNISKGAKWNLNSIYLRDQDEALINFLNDLDNGL